MSATIEGVECYNTGESATYLEVSPITFTRKVEAYNKEYPQEKIAVYHDKLRSTARYYKVTDLDKLKGFRAS